MKTLERLLFRRPRALNLLHRFHLVNPTSQTIEPELNVIARHARGSRLALEIGSYQGVSAVRIAAVMEADSTLFCVDPWPGSYGEENACYAIFQRHVRRAGLESRIRPVRLTSAEIRDIVPNNLDFAFVDGDHSWSGIETDWRLVREKVRPGGIICLHDSFIPPNESWRHPESVRFFKELIAPDPEFTAIDRVHSLAVLRRVTRK